MHRTLVTCAILAGMSAGIAVSAAEAQTELQFGHIYTTGEPFHQWAVWAGEQIEERTEGRYSVEVFSDSQLGSEAQLSEGLTLGTVDMAYLGALFASRSYGPIAIVEAPYILRDDDHWQAYFDSDLFEEHRAGFAEATGHAILAPTYYGARHVTANRPINTPEDMSGLRIRVPDAPLYTLFPRTMGASPTPIAFAEVYLALQQGVVDAQENPLPTILAQRFYEVQDYISLTGHIRNSLLTTIAGGVWDGLTEEDREIFREVFSEAAANASGEIRESEARLVEEFREMGVEVVEVDVAPFMEAMQPALTGPDATWPEEDFERMQALGQ
ncbi:sialic acid TRAP transporter substrate-binding protein SiaP [soil metagenome]